MKADDVGMFHRNNRGRVVGQVTSCRNGAAQQQLLLNANAERAVGNFDLAQALIVMAASAVDAVEPMVNILSHTCTG